MIPISYLLTPNPSSICRVQTIFIWPEFKNLSATTTSLLLGVFDINREIFDYYALAIQKTNQKTGIDSSLQLETKHLSLRAKINDVKKKLENLAEAISKVRFRVVQILLVASHEMSQTHTLHALINIYDIWKRTQRYLDDWRELPLSQDPNSWEPTRSDICTHYSLKRTFRQSLCDPTYNWFFGKTKAWTVLLIKDKDLGVFHEVSLINSPPAFTLSGNSPYIKYTTLEQAVNYRRWEVTNLLTFLHGSIKSFLRNKVIIP